MIIRLYEVFFVFRVRVFFGLVFFRVSVLASSLIDFYFSGLLILNFRYLKY